MKNYEKRNKNKNKNNKKQWKATKNSEKQWQAMTSYEKRWKTDGLAVVLWWFVDERMDGRTDKRTKKRHTSLLTKIRVQPTQSLDMFVPKPTPSLTKVICICDLPLGMASLYLSFSLIYIQLSCWKKVRKICNSQQLYLLTRDGGTIIPDHDEGAILS